ncbi:restriction endonuclease subunit S [Candidatus Phytoplasma luffae]|uniref:restriction endonuclease subunit S n=1 Tax=Loofah witches'-broom phytoplasma TaxID=35773 RepID=UPI001B3703DE|nr:restriction endonuclease subunit S [Candidatus Phytoplasma luffae]
MAKESQKFPNCPLLRFKGFKDEWQEVELKDVCEIKKGKQLNRSCFIDDGKYYVMNGGTKPSGYYDEYNTLGNTITISQGGSCGYVCYHKKPFWCGGDAFKLISKTNTKQNQLYYYLYYYLKNNEPSLTKLAYGTSIKHISQKDIIKISIILPSFKEQTKIANFLNLLDQIINLEQTLLNNYDKQKKYFFNQLLC